MAILACRNARDDPGLPMRAACALICLTVPGLSLAQLPSVASINLCTDQLVLSVADPSQILSLSWLSADPEESMLAGSAQDYLLNYGSAEELLRLDADLVVAGTETSAFTRETLRRLGMTVVEISPATSLEQVRRNIRIVGESIDRLEAADAIIDAMRNREAMIRSRQAEPAVSAIVVRPGGFTVGRETLAHELITLAGLDNRIAELDRWGSLSVETLLTAKPEIIVFTTYRRDEASLANRFLAHPSLESVRGSHRVIDVPAKYFACGAPASLIASEFILEQRYID
jgi:iron complex transport system substrate-binding protein